MISPLVLFSGKVNKAVRKTYHIFFANSRASSLRNPLQFYRKFVTQTICSPECYEQVDWSPLEEREIYYLISNHSKVPLEKDPLTLAFVKARSGIEAESPFDIYFDKVWKEYHAEKNINLAEYKNKEFKRIFENYHDRRLLDEDIFPILRICHGTFTDLKEKVGLSKTRK